MNTESFKIFALRISAINLSQRTNKMNLEFNSELISLEYKRPLTNQQELIQQGNGQRTYKVFH